MHITIAYRYGHISMVQLYVKFSGNISNRLRNITQNGPISFRHEYWKLTFSSSFIYTLQWWNILFRGWFMYDLSISDVNLTVCWIFRNFLKQIKFWDLRNIFLAFFERVIGSWVCYLNSQQHFLHFELSGDVLAENKQTYVIFQILTYILPWWPRYLTVDLESKVRRCNCGWNLLKICQSICHLCVKMG